ncbi:MAG: putative membrane protein [Myxococcota bacterium]|jgi:uncharacterized membrane protein
MITAWMLLLGCGREPYYPPEDTGTPQWCADAPGATWASFGEGFLLTHCQGCHASTSADRYGAPDGVHFDSEDEARMWRERLIAVILDNQSMPPAGGLTDEERLLAESWLYCDL